MPTDHAVLGTELAPIGLVGRQDSVSAIEQDMGLGQTLQKSCEFGQQWHTGILMLPRLSVNSAINGANYKRQPPEKRTKH
jgi:hypothetical protein